MGGRREYACDVQQSISYLAAGLSSLLTKAMRGMLYLLACLHTVMLCACSEREGGGEEGRV